MNLYIKNDFNGILVTDYENPLKLSQAIVKGVRNEDVRGVLIKNARQSIQKFSRKNVDKWEMALMKYFLSFGEQYFFLLFRYFQIIDNKVRESSYLEILFYLSLQDQIILTR